MSRRYSLGWILTLLAVGLSPPVASAQAWLPDKGSFNTSFIFNNQLFTAHWGPNGETFPGINVRSETYALLANYGVTDRVMVSAVLPYINTRHEGPPSHGGAPGFDVDDGDWHGSLTDLRVGVHYQALERPFALAPFIAYVTPVTDYYTRGHAAQGRHLNELLLGFNVGKSLDAWLPRTYTQLRYSYAFVEEVQDIEHDRSNLNLEFGTFFTPRWNVSLYGAWQWTHGGIDLPIGPNNPYFFNHDLIGEDEFFNAGVGTGFAVTPEITAFAIYMQGIDGKNGHKLDQSLTFGFSYGYRPRAEAVLAESETEEP